MTLKELNDKKHKAEDKFWNHLDGRKVDPTVTEELEGAMIDASEDFDKAVKARVEELAAAGVEDKAAHLITTNESLGLNF